MMSDPLKTPASAPESHSPKAVPEIIKLAAEETLRPQETLAETFDVNGAAVEVVDWRETIWCGKLAYGRKNGAEPNVDKLLNSYLKLDNPALTREPSEPEWAVCVSLNYMMPRSRGIMFGMQVDTERQPKVYDIYKVPPARFMRVLLCEETAAALGVEMWRGGIPPYQWIGERIAPRFGYRYGSDTLPVFEYYGYYDPETNRHKFCYLYVPVERADEESYSPKEKPEIVSMAAARGAPRIAYSVRRKGGEADSFETERLLIRHFRREDWRDMQEIAICNSQSEFADFDHAGSTDGKSVRNSCKWMAGQKQIWAAEVKAISKVVCFISFNGMNDAGEMDAGHMMNEAHAGSDYDYEALAVLFDYCFRHDRPEAIIALWMMDDRQKLAPLAKLGMRLINTGMGKSWRPNSEGVFWEAEGCRAVISREDWEHANPTSYSPKEKPEIVKLAEQTQKKKERFSDRLSEITLVELPKSMVASYEVISDSPEGEGGAFIEAWLEKRGLKAGENGVVRYGFDCHKGRDICGENTACAKEQKGCWKCRIYHQYVTLPADTAIVGDDDVAIKEFPGGRFARIAVRDPFTCDFPSAWYELLKWTFKKKIPNRLGCTSKKDCYSLFSNEESPCLEEIYEENGVQYMAMYLPVE